MNAALSYLSASAIAFFSLLILPVAAQAATASRPSDETTVAAVVQKGDVVIVNTDDASLMLGSAVLAKLPSGQKLPIVAIQGSWLGTSLKIGGKSLSGWVLSTNVTLARTGNSEKAKLVDLPSSGQEKASAAESVAALPPATAGSNSRPGEACYVAAKPACDCRTSTEMLGVYDFYWSGHYEPDPDIHAWEPWRHHY